MNEWTQIDLKNHLISIILNQSFVSFVFTAAKHRFSSEVLRCYNVFMYIFHFTFIILWLFHLVLKQRSNFLSFSVFSSFFLFKYSLSNLHLQNLNSQLFSIILLRVPHMLEVQQNGIVLGTLVVDVWRVVCDCRELTNVFVFVCPQVDRALGIPHRRSNQLQIQNKVHLAHRGLVSRTTSQHFLILLLKQSMKRQNWMKGSLSISWRR